MKTQNTKTEEAEKPEEKEKTKEKDFVEVDFTARIKDGNIFDTTIKEEAKKVKLPAKNLKPLKICIGQDMVVKGFDEALREKEINKEYTIEILPEKAFGIRDPKLVKIIPLAFFIKKDINPVPGTILTMDSLLVRVISVSSGRVLVDFNNPLAGKIVEYDFKITKKITDKKEKLLCLAEFFFGKSSLVEEKGKNIIETEKDFFKEIIKKFKEKVENLLHINVDVRKKQESKKKEKLEKKESG